MSAIFGLIQLDGFATERHSIQQMAEALAHRGPDDTSILLGGSMGLGHCMLHSTPESLHEVQPLKRGPLLRYILERGIRPYVPTKGLMAWRRLRRQPQYPAYEQIRILHREFVHKPVFMSV